MTIARKEIIIEGVSRIYHCISRCVRRAFLCGTDEYTGRSFEHSKDWIKNRLEHLAACFAIEVCAYAVMSSHTHIILRTRPDFVDSWTNEEIARQWLKVFHERTMRAVLCRPMREN